VTCRPGSTIDYGSLDLWLGIGRKAHSRQAFIITLFLTLYLEPSILHEPFICQRLTMCSSCFICKATNPNFRSTGYEAGDIRCHNSLLRRLQNRSTLQSTSPPTNSLSCVIFYILWIFQKSTVLSAWQGTTAAPCPLVVIYMSKIATDSLANLLRGNMRQLALCVECAGSCRPSPG
jgi:hypothetical protein